MPINNKIYLAFYSALQGDCKARSLDEVETSYDIAQWGVEYLRKLGFTEGNNEELSARSILIDPIKLREALDALPLIKPNHKLKTDLNHQGWSKITSDRYFLFPDKDVHYFVDTQGYTYPRYITRLFNYQRAKKP